jgi:hypothetical protein
MAHSVRGEIAVKTNVPQRARSVAEWLPMAVQVFDGDEIAASIASWQPRASDVVISPFAKCGTTWLQQTFHTLRTRGDMDFDDISRVVPWIETSRALDIDLEAPQRAGPRGFKSHLPYDRLPGGARAVVSLRDPKDALVSFYRFMEGWFLEPGAVSIAEFAAVWIARAGGDGGYWHHLTSWWEQRDNPDVLLLSYEHMTADPALHVRKLAAFCGIALDEPLLVLTLERSSLTFMLRHKDKFDDLGMRTMSERRCHLPPGSDSAKVRTGGKHARELSPELIAELDAIWTKTVTPRLGFADYASLEKELRRRNSN